MPKKAVFSKSGFFDTAFALFESKGLEAITARNWEKHFLLPQHLYTTSISSITDLKNETYICCKRQIS